MKIGSRKVHILSATKSVATVRAVHQTHWDRHMQNYDLLQGNFSHHKRLVSFAVKALKNRKNVLDTGSGTGSISLPLLRQGVKVTAVDISSVALKILKKRAPKKPKIKSNSCRYKQVAF